MQLGASEMKAYSHGDRDLRFFNISRLNRIVFQSNSSMRSENLIFDFLAYSVTARGMVLVQ